jgi:hypothetical protein
MVIRVLNAFNLVGVVNACDVVAIKEECSLGSGGDKRFANIV